MHFCIFSATFIASFDLSMPIILQFGLSLINDIAMHPEPVPISKMFLHDDTGKSSKIFQ